MRRVLCWIAFWLMVAALCAEGSIALARSPVQPIPTPRQPPSLMSPTGGVKKMPLPTPSSKATTKRSWSPFGKRNKIGSH